MIGAEVWLFRTSVVDGATTSTEPLVCSPAIGTAAPLGSVPWPSANQVSGDGRTATKVQVKSAAAPTARVVDRKGVVKGKRADLGGSGIIGKKTVLVSVFSKVTAAYEIKV